MDGMPYIEKVPPQSFFSVPDESVTAIFLQH